MCSLKETNLPIGGKCSLLKKEFPIQLPSPPYPKVE